MRYVLLLIVIVNTKAFAECARNTDLPATLEESIKAHPERFDSYKLQRTPVETALKAVSKKYGVEAKKEIIPPLDKNEASRTCLTEFEFDFLNKRAESIKAFCLVSARILDGKTMGYSVRYCERGTEDKVLAKSLDFKID